MTPILILAAGQSTRMRGRDKLLELVGGIPQLRRLVIEAGKTGAPVYVALPHPGHPRRDVLHGLPVTLLAVPDAIEGLSGTMRGAVAQLPLCTRFMIVLGDLVELDATDMQAVLSAAIAQADALIWRGATADGKPGHPILFDASLIPKFKTLRGDGGGESLVKPLISQTIMVPLPGKKARLDLDTPEDWAAWRAGI